MAKYGFIVREIYERPVVVEAENIADGYRKINKAMEEERLVIGLDDYDQTSVEPDSRLLHGRFPDDVSEAELMPYWSLD